LTVRREFVTGSEEATLRLGRELAREITPPLLVVLRGNLGMGKTTVAKGIIAGLGVAREEDVHSPSFTLIHPYGVKPRVYHVDLYRVEAGRDLATLGLEDLWSPDAVLLVEWGEKLPPGFAPRRWEVQISDLGGDQRRIILDATC
jgi:tRNA threonylcarbamoyladenosine biosynthesis protein TsaE